MTLVPENTTTKKHTSQIVEDLMSGLSVFLTGLPSSGRSYLVRLVTEELSLSGVAVVAVRGNRMLLDRPLSALALAGVDVDSSQHAPGSAPGLVAVEKSLRSLMGTHSGVLIVDDADALDQASTGVIADLRTKRDMPMLLVGPYGLGASESLSALLGVAQPGVALAMGEMPFGGVTQMANAILGGVTEASTISKIADLSGGLPGLVQAIVRGGRRSGRLVQTAGVWTAEGSLWDNSLRLVLSPFLRGLDKVSLESLTRLAAIRRLSLPEARDLIGPVQVSELIQSGVLRLDRFSTAVGAHVFPPALSELLRRTGGDFEVEATHDQVSFLSGMHLLKVTGVEAGVLAERVMEKWQDTVDRDWAIWEHDRSPANAVPLLMTLFSGVTNEERINVVFSQTDPGTDPASSARFASLVATYRALALYDLPGAVEQFGKMRKEFPQYADRIRGHEAHLTLVCDRVPTPELLGPGALGPNGGEDDMLMVARAETFVAQGRIEDAAQILANLEADTKRVLVVKQVLEGMVQILDGDAHAGVDWAIERLGEAVDSLDSRAITCHAYVAAFGMTMLGRFDELESMVEVVYRLAEMNFLQNYYKLGLFLLGSFVADWEGRRNYARNLSAQARSLGVEIGPFPGMFSDMDELFKQSSSADRVWDTVDDLLERGFVVTATYLAVPGVEIHPMTKRSASVVAAAAKTQSKTVRALGRYIDVASNARLDEFEQVVAELRAVCGPLDATRARITWALILREQGDSAGWLAQAQAAWTTAGAITRSCDGVFARLVDAVDLTGREGEVAGYAAQGQSSSGIAAKIGVSVRTVETHLQAVYRKTGVTNRDELRQILRTWFVL
ncbi:MAG: LuxR C-terminal-related transcriptional regulator [Propionibacteriaceae bacterium]|nr:LuxR C-terminal-related transcriptional regulator [Propionibacteriaceae bacterium]